MILNTLKLLLPALIPSWNFFDVIAPSPRIEFSLLNSDTDTPTKWHAFRPRPAQLSFRTMLKRMLWNPFWNETLFMMSCAERIMKNPTQSHHSETEILNRIINETLKTKSNKPSSPATHLQFRLLTVQRDNEQLVTEINFESRIQALPKKLSTSGDA